MSGPARRRTYVSDGPRLVAQLWLGSRLLLLGLCAATMWATGRKFSDAVGNWDVQHFLKIAREGYVDPQEVAFFPGLPLLLRLVGAVGIDPYVAGVVISVVASAVTAAALYRLGGPRAGVVAAGLWLVAPTAVFTVVPYTESLFCALAFWAWVRARENRWAWAGILSALACSVRVSGLFLVAALAVMAVVQGRTWAQRWSRGRWLGLAGAVLFAYASYLRITKGSWLAWYDAQAAGWNRGLTWPWESFQHTIPAIVPGAYADHPGWAWVFRAEVVSVAVGLAVTIWCLVKRRWPEATWVGLQVVAFTTSYWFMSVNRAVLLWFPMWVLLGEWVVRQGHRRWRVAILAVWAGVSLALMLGWAALFYTGRWAS